MGNRESSEGRDVAVLRHGLELLGRGALLVAERSPLLLEHWEHAEERLQRMETNVATLQHSVDTVKTHLGRMEDELARLVNRDLERETRLVALETSIEKALVCMFPRVDALLAGLEKTKDVKIVNEQKSDKNCLPRQNNPETSTSANTFIRNQSSSDLIEDRHERKAENQACPSSFSTSSDPIASTQDNSNLFEDWGGRWIDEWDNALLEAAKEGRTADVQCLIAAGANINAENDHKRTPLMLAAYEGHAECLLILLQAGANVYCRDMNEYLPLHAAACRGHGSAVHVLLQAGVDVNARDGATGSTAMVLAASKGHAECVYTLLQNCADVKSTDDDGMTALHRAVMYGHARSVSLLLQKGADVNCVDKRGWSSLDYAFRSGTEEVKQILSEMRRRDMETRRCARRH